MPATAAIRVATRALRACATVCVLGALSCAPAKALSFSWSFTVTGGSNQSYIGETISGTIDNLIDNTWNTTNMTAKVTSAPFGPGNGMSWTDITLSFSTEKNADGSLRTKGIYVKEGVIDTEGLQAYFIYNGQDRLILQNPIPYGYPGGGRLDDYSTGQYAQMDNGFPPTFTAVPAPLPLLRLGAATAFSRKLKQRIALRRKWDEVGLAG